MDAVSAELSRLDHGIRVVIHPTVPSQRDAAGRLLVVGVDGDPVESWLHSEIDGVDSDELAALEEDRRAHLRAVLPP